LIYVMYTSFRETNVKEKQRLMYLCFLFINQDKFS
jgi:hypothetical protein